MLRLSWLLVVVLLMFVGTLVSSARVNYREQAAVSALVQKKTETSTGESIVDNRPSQVQCAKGGSKRHPDPKDENKFYMCSYSSAHRVWMVFSFNCPSETVFDGKTQKCSRKEALLLQSSSSAQAANNNGRPGAGVAPSQKFNFPKQKVRITARPASAVVVRPATNSNSNNKRKTQVVQGGTRITTVVGSGAKPLVSSTSSSSSSSPSSVVAGGLRIPVRRINQAKTTTPRTRPHFTIRYPLVKIPYTTPIPTSRATTATTTTTITTTTPTPLPEIFPPHIKANLTDEEAPSFSSSSTKHVSVIRDVANKIAYLAQAIETLLTSFESKVTAKYCEEESGGAAPFSKTPSSTSIVDQIIQQVTGGGGGGEGQSSPSSSPETSISSEDKTSSNEENNPESFLSQPQLSGANNHQASSAADNIMDLSSVPENSSEEPAEWSFILNQANPSAATITATTRTPTTTSTTAATTMLNEVILNPTSTSPSASSTPSKAEQVLASSTDNLSESDEDLVKIPNLQQFFQTTTNNSSSSNGNSSSSSSDASNMDSTKFYNSQQVLESTKDTPPPPPVASALLSNLSLSQLSQPPSMNENAGIIAKVQDGAKTSNRRPRVAFQ